MSMKLQHILKEISEELIGDDKFAKINISTEEAEAAFYDVWSNEVYVNPLTMEEEWKILVEEIIDAGMSSLLPDFTLESYARAAIFHEQGHHFAFYNRQSAFWNFIDYSSSLPDSLEGIDFSYLRNLRIQEETEAWQDGWTLYGEVPSYGQELERVCVSSYEYLTEDELLEEVDRARVMYRLITKE